MTTSPKLRGVSLRRDRAAREGGAVSFGQGTQSWIGFIFSTVGLSRYPDHGIAVPQTFRVEMRRVLDLKEELHRFPPTMWEGFLTGAWQS